MPEAETAVASQVRDLLQVAETDTDTDTDYSADELFPDGGTTYPKSVSCHDSAKATGKSGNASARTKDDFYQQQVVVDSKSAHQIEKAAKPVPCMV